MLSVLSILRRLYRILKFFVPCFLFCSDDVFSKVHLYAVCCCRSTWNRLAAMLNYPMPAELQSQISIFYVSHSHSADPFLALFCKYFYVDSAVPLIFITAAIPTVIGFYPAFGSSGVFYRYWNPCAVLCLLTQGIASSGAPLRFWT